ncbi:hypothetical protein BJY04DRAFT_195780, partial [Aspergillus karnatakaensis]|uniref:uncharacterized protein n=1 Tax=Aspergillus karnatakaensis TaxID=1810916 RepID=UPI003CCCC5C6
MAKKPLGRSSGSLNAPIAAFTMAVVLCSYCIYSINSARRGVQTHQGQLGSEAAASASTVQRRQRQDDWVKKVLEEKEGGSGRG